MAANDNAGRDLSTAAGAILKSLEVIKAIRETPTKAYRAFNNLGEFAIAVAKADRGDVVDYRLVRAPAGANINDPSAGGFTVPDHLTQDLLRSVYSRAVIAPYCDLRLTDHPYRETKIPGVEEASRVNGSRNGGATASWSPEGVTPAKTVLKYRAVAFQPKKLISLAKCTNELLSDAPMLSAHLNDVLGDELGFQLDLAVLLGTGSGVPTGVLNSSCLITVPAETGQTAGTIVKENIDKMFARLPAASRRRSAWLVSEDVTPQLFALNQAVAPGSAFVFNPVGSVPGAPYATLYGCPVIETEMSPTLGSKGDIILTDLTKYILVQAPTTFTLSLHSGFDQDEVTFKIRMLVDGKSSQVSPLTPYQGSVTKSPFVTLGAR